MDTNPHIDDITGMKVLGISTCTEAQFEVLSACLLGGDDANRAFNQSITIHLKGPLNVAALNQALKHLVEINEALRMVFDLSKNQFLVLENMPFELEVLNGNTTLEALKNVHALHSFDLRKGPLFLTSALSLSENQHHLVFTAHHAVCDGWTLGLFIQEVSELYNAYNSNKTIEVQAQSYLKYAEDEQALLQSEPYKNSSAYWLDIFKNYSPQSGLPYEWPRSTTYSYKSANLTFPINRDLFASIRQMGKLQESTVLISMVSAFEVLLYRMSRQSEFVIGIPTAGQNTRSFPQLMGHCVNMLPVLCKVNGDMSFSDYLKQRKSAYSDAFSHRNITFGSLLKTIKTNRDPSASPFVPVSFNIDRPLGDALNFDNCEAQLEINKREYSSLEMIMNLARVGDDLTIECAYHEALFSESTVSRILEQYNYLLEQLCLDPHLPLNSYALYDEKALQLSYENLNNTQQALNNEDSFISGFESQVKLYSDKTALLCGNESYTYQELNSKANKLAHYLKSQGCGKGDFIAVMLDRSTDLLVSLLAVMKTGAAYIPIDPEFPSDRIQYILEDAEAKLLIASHAVEFSGGFKTLRLENIFSEIEHLNSENLDIKINSEDSVYLIYTSGTTGKPKGVLLKHGNLFNLLNSVQKQPGFTHKDALLAITTVSFDIAGLELYLPLITGGKLVLLNNGEAKNADVLLDKLKQNEISFFQATPSTYKMLLANNWSGNADLVLLCGGEALPYDLAMALLPKCKSLWNMYGPTETCIWSLIKQINSSDTRIEIGKPIDNTEVYILDEENHIQSFGVQGEICIAGAGLADSYYKRAELTQEKFVAHPLDPKKRIYKTGDLGLINEQSNVLCLGRTDNQIKLRGYRIEIEEIEQVLGNVNKGVKETLVLMSNWNQNDQRLLALVCPTEQTDIDFQSQNELQFAFLNEAEEFELRAVAAKSLPEYMLPANYLYIQNIPLTPNGKIDRKRLQGLDYFKLFQSRSSAGADSVKADGEHSWTENELALKQIWEETLGTVNAQADDDFFASGGHSLLAIEMMFKIEKKFNVKLPLSSLFSNSNITSLAKLLETGNVSKWKYLVPIQAKGNKPPLYIVHGLGLEVMVFKDIAKYIEDDQPIIGVQAMGLSGNDEPLKTVEEISKVYLDEILAHNPNGPYHIAGFSAGFILAYELAQQLQKNGKNIASLINFDFALETVVHQTQVKRSLKNKLSEFLPRQKHVIKSLMAFPEIEWKYQKTYFKLSVEGFLRKLGFKIDDGDPPSMDEMFRIIDLYRLAMSNYEFKPYHGNMDILVSLIKTYYLKDPVTLGWCPLVKGEIKTYPVNGQHDDMIIGEYAKGFTKSLQTILDLNNEKYLAK